MKRLIFSLFLLSFPFILAAQESREEPDYPYYERIRKYESFWNKLIPTHTKIQYAGSMGFLSFGLGWDYGSKNRWETDIFLGFIPKFSTDKVKMTMTLKQSYMPWKVRLGGKGFSFEPLSCGFYITTIFGRQFWATNPDYYPDDYYGFSTKVRFNFFLGERITFTLPSHKRFFARSFTFFYEISCNDNYIYAAYNDSYLKPKDYLKLSVGLKTQFF